MGTDGAVVTRLPQSNYPVRELITERFDLIKEPNTVLYDLTYREYGEDADGTVAWIARDGEAAVQESFVRYLTDIYPTLETDGAMVWEANEAEAWTELRMQFRLPGYGAEGRTSLKTRAYQLIAATPDFEGGMRTLPFALSHPRHVRQVREYVVDDGYEFNDRTRTVETNSFRFSYDETIEGDLFREDYQLQSKQDHIAAKDFKNDMEKIDKLQDWSYSTINLHIEADQSIVSPATGRAWVVALIVLLLIGLPVLIVVTLRRANERARAVEMT